MFDQLQMDVASLNNATAKTIKAQSDSLAQYVISHSKQCQSMIDLMTSFVPKTYDLVDMFRMYHAMRLANEKT